MNRAGRTIFTEKNSDGIEDVLKTAFPSFNALQMQSFQFPKFSAITVRVGKFGVEILVLSVPRLVRQMWELETQAHPV